MAHLPVGPRANSPERHINPQHSYDQPQLPDGWNSFTDRDSGKVFYESPTGTRQWEHPISDASYSSTQASSDYISSESTSYVPHSYVATTHTQQNQDTNQFSDDLERITPCMDLTKTLAELTKNAMDNNRLPEVIYRAMQMKNRNKKYKKLLSWEGSWGLAFLPITPTTVTTAAIGGSALSALQAWGSAHTAVVIRSENVYKSALGYIKKNLGEQFSDKINDLKYDKKGLSTAKSLLYEVDRRFNIRESNPYYNTKILSQKEVDKGGNINDINDVEFNRVFQALTAYSTGSSYASGSEVRRRNV